MPVMYVVFKDLLQCVGCLTTIENALYSSGAKHFDYDLEKKIGKIVFEQTDTSEIELIDAIEKVGFHVDVIEMIED